MIRAARSDEQITLVGYRNIATQLHSHTLQVQTRENLLDIGESNSVALEEVDAVLVRSMPMGSLEQIIFRVNALHALNARRIPIFNSPRTLEVAIDKWLTLDIAARAGLPTPPTCVAQTRAQAMEHFDVLKGNVVVKPVFGGEGRGLMHINDRDLAWRVFGTLEQCQSIIYQQAFLRHSGDIRILFIGDEHYAIRRTNESDWRVNLSLGGIAQPYTPTRQELAIASEARMAIHADIAGVDLMRTDDGHLYLIEINAVPGWKGLAHCLKVDIARRVLDTIRSRCESDCRII